MTFSDLGLSEELLRAVSDAGYSDPTPIQEQAIPIVLMGRDVLGCNLVWAFCSSPRLFPCASSNDKRIGSTIGANRQRAG